jgi:hypothetical protein
MAERSPARPLHSDRDLLRAARTDAGRHARPPRAPCDLHDGGGHRHRLARPFSASARRRRARAREAVSTPGPTCRVHKVPLDGAAAWPTAWARTDVGKVGDSRGRRARALPHAFRLRRRARRARRESAPHALVVHPAEGRERPDDIAALATALRAMPEADLVRKICNGCDASARCSTSFAAACCLPPSCWVCGARRRRQHDPAGHQGRRDEIVIIKLIGVGRRAPAVSLHRHLVWAGGGLVALLVVTAGILLLQGRWSASLSSTAATSGSERGLGSRAPPSWSPGASWAAGILVGLPATSAPSSRPEPREGPTAS